MAEKLTDLERTSLGGLLLGMSSSYGGGRAQVLADAGQALLDGKKPDVKALQVALTWNRIPNAAISKVVAAYGGDTEVEPQVVELPSDDVSPARKTAAKKTAAKAQ